MEKLKKIITIIKNILNKIEDYSIVALLTTMILAALLQIIFRVGFDLTEKLYKNIINFKFYTILKDFSVQLNPIIKYSVLWAGLLAAGIATSKNNHIKIDIVGRFIKGRVKSFVHIITNLIAFGVCFTIVFYSIIYIIEVEFTSKEASPFFYIPRWVLVIILPIGFSIIGFRFLIRVFEKIKNFIKNIEDEKEAEDSFSVDLEEKSERG